MNTRFKVFASYNILQYLCDFIHVLIFITVSKCQKSPKSTNIVIHEVSLIGFWWLTGLLTDCQSGCWDWVESSSCRTPFWETLKEAELLNVTSRAANHTIVRTEVGSCAYHIASAYWFDDPLVVDLKNPNLKTPPGEVRPSSLVPNVPNNPRLLAAAVPSTCTSTARTRTMILYTYAEFRPAASAASLTLVLISDSCVGEFCTAQWMVYLRICIGSHIVPEMWINSS
jgi:hypothetical protein